MSFLGIFGGDKKTTNTTANTQSSDMRTAVTGSVGSLIAPGAAVATPGGGAVNASPGSSVSQSITNEGMTGDDVTTIMSMLQTDRQAERAAVTNLGNNLATGVRQQAEQTADILAATKAPDSNTLTQLLPVLLLVVLLYFLSR